MTTRRTNYKGSVLWVALVAIIVAMGIAMSQLQTSVSNSRSQDSFTTQSNAFFTTHGATELVISDLWGRFSNVNQTTTQNFLTFLNSQITFAQVATGTGDLIAEDLRANTPSYTIPANSPIPVKDNPTIVTSGTTTKYNGIVLGDRMITKVKLYKKERPQPGHFIMDLLVVVETQKNLGTDATTQATLVTNLGLSQATAAALPQWESQLFNCSSPPPFNGFDYAILTKELTCTLCHMHARSRSVLDNIASTLQTPAGTKGYFGTFDHVKVGITDYLGVRQGGEYSQVDGTLFQRGSFQYEGTHANMTPAQVVAEPLSSVAMGTNSTTINQNTVTGAMTSVPFHNETTDANGNTITVPNANGNFYMNYATTAAGQTAGVLPTSNFPSPFPEIPTAVTLSNGTVITGPNNKIDPIEVTAASSDLIAFSDSTKPSTLTGGTGVTLAAGVSYQGLTLPTGTTAIPTSGGNVVPGALNITSSYTGNVVMTGTTTNPIVIDGKIMIDGDVVLRGYVQGTGQIYATGNIYAPGDVIYNNVNVGTINEQFGVNSDPNPQKAQNLLALVAGKNVVVGDYLSQVTYWASENSDFYMPYTYNKTTNTVTPNPGSPEPGMALTYSSSATTTFLNPMPVDSFPSVTLPTVSSPALTVKNINGTNVTTYTGTSTSYSSKTTKSPSNQSWGANNFANFTIEQMSYFNRNEMAKIMPKLPTADPTLASSYTSSSAVTNPNYDPNYIPKFYSLYAYNSTTPASTPPLAFMYSGSTWDNTNMHWNGTDDPHGYEYMTSVDAMPAGSLGPAVSAKNVINIHPPWIDPNTMMRILSDEENKHVPVIADPIHGDPASNYMVPDRRLDGILYTKNAIFCIERKASQFFDTATGLWSKVNSKSNGFMQVNGALIAPDTGILVTGNSASNFTNDMNNRQAFIVNYDGRAKSFLNLGSQSFNGFNSWGAPVRKGLVRSAAFMPGP